jgi:hypothetical protein
MTALFPPIPVLDEALFPSTREVLARLNGSRAPSSPASVDGAASRALQQNNGRSECRVECRRTGHRIVYGDHGRRILCLEPAGTILHECEWTTNLEGTVRLSRARVRLDSLLWLGVVPEAVTRSTVLNLPAGSGRSRPTPEELRRMAARTWQAPIEDVRYFYPDENFVWSEESVAIRLKKDGIYLLDDGTFDRPRFISYMGAMPWDRIDLLNVVELFQSTLPGTGSAILELIWGFCDDQRRRFGPVALRYRGLPTYPSEPAYGLFCAFFRPDAPEGEDPHALFLDQARANRIAWWPREEPPWRYVDRLRGLTVTVHEGAVQKVTVPDDSAGVPYVAPGTRGGFASCRRVVAVEKGLVHLKDGAASTAYEPDPRWGVTRDTPPPIPTAAPFDWRRFLDSPLPLDPVRVHSLALFYPDDETEVPEYSVQPFVLEQLYASLNRLSEVRSTLARCDRVLVDGFDAVAAGCIDLDYARRTTILYRSPEWAQRQAQVLWDLAARAGRLEAVRETRFLCREQEGVRAYRDSYDLMFVWLPFARYEDVGLRRWTASVVGASLAPSGLAFLVGPPNLRLALTVQQLRVLDVRGSADLAHLPLLTEHLRLHPRTRLNPALTIFLVEQPAGGG